MTKQYDITQLVAIPMKDSTLSLEVYDKMYLFELFGIPINVTIMSTWIVMLVLLFISWMATRRLKSSLKAGKFQTFVEVIVLWLNGEVKAIPNKKPEISNNKIEFKPISDR